MGYAFSAQSVEGCKVVVNESNVVGNGYEDLNVIVGVLFKPRRVVVGGGAKRK